MKTSIGMCFQRLDQKQGQSHLLQTKKISSSPKCSIASHVLLGQDMASQWWWVHLPRIIQLHSLLADLDFQPFPLDTKPSAITLTVQFQTKDNTIRSQEFNRRVLHSQITAILLINSHKDSHEFIVFLLQYRYSQNDLHSKFYCQLKPSFINKSVVELIALLIYPG